MEDNDNNEDYEVEIDPELYERLAILCMRRGRNDVTEFINDLLEWIKFTDG
jgi:hypothetical protein